MASTQAPRFAIGTTYMGGPKRNIVHTVADVHITRNLAGDVVRIGYLAVHKFCGQDVQTIDVCDTTIARNLIKAA